MSAGQNGPDDSEISDQLILSMYIDDSGRALINGYVDDPESLAILRSGSSSEYTYDNGSRELYALTGALTTKSGNNWTIQFESTGSYDEYLVMIYLPEDARLKGVKCSSGIDRLVSASNESFIIECHGSGITDPAIFIEYLIPLAKSPRADGNDFRDGYAGYSYRAIALFFLLAAGLCLLALMLRSRNASVKAKDWTETGKAIASPTAPAPDSSHLSVPLKDNNDPGWPSLLRDEKMGPGASSSNKDHVEAMELTGEVSALMDTLTDREKSIMKILLKRGGAMTQTDLRTELDMSKSSLSGILTSMERRKIITKRGKGRTNVIELSKEFLNHRERS
ncbi:MAG: hypothetical protein PHQ34_06265 [Methanothrix sp.]|nr:hypothetical protein [Methanothrix sp.]